MIWVITGLVVIALALWIPTFMRRALLENSLQFGRDFYEVDLQSVVGVGAQRQFILRQIKVRGERTPQAVFFMLVPSVLGLLDGLKKWELYEGLLQLQISGAISELTVAEFVHEYEKSDGEGYNWAENALNPLAPD